MFITSRTKLSMGDILVVASFFLLPCVLLVFLIVFAVAYVALFSCNKSLFFTPPELRTNGHGRCLCNQKMNKIVLDVDVIDKCSIRRLRVILLPIGEKYYIQAHFCKVYANYLKLNGTE